MKSTSKFPASSGTPPKAVAKLLILSLLLVSLFSFLILKTVNPTYSQDSTEKTPKKVSEKTAMLEEAKARYNCPVDISKLEIPSSLEKDFTTATQKDYEDYFKNFRTSLKNLMYQDLAKVYTEKYKTAVTTAMIKDVVENAGTINLPGQDVTIKEQMQVKSEINSCFNQDLEIAMTVEKAVKMSESQAYITNYLVNMLTEYQKKLNLHRDEVLEPGVLKSIDASNSSPVKVSS
jgi:hypothetical protein